MLIKSGPSPPWTLAEHKKNKSIGAIVTFYTICGEIWCSNVQASETYLKSVFCK